MKTNKKGTTFMTLRIFICINTNKYNWANYNFVFIPQKTLNISNILPGPGATAQTCLPQGRQNALVHCHIVEHQKYDRYEKNRVKNTGDLLNWFFVKMNRLIATFIPIKINRNNPTSMSSKLIYMFLFKETLYSLNQNGQY